jgi:hypothetical protein
MSAETFVNYWSGQEPTPPSPPLGAMPPAVDVAPLAFVGIDDQYRLTFDFLCSTHSAAIVQTGIEEVRANGTRVLFSILDSKLATVPDVDAFVNGVAEQAVEWGVDGVDLDYEPPELGTSQKQTLLAVAQALRPALGAALGREPLLTAPIYSAWLAHTGFLGKFAAELDFVTTMDYTPWPGVAGMENLFTEYAGAIGSPEKIAIGVSCMGPSGTGNLTPIDDVTTICGWEPTGGAKAGVMLYTFSYDVKTRTVYHPGAPPTTSGTGLPDGTFTNTIIENLP